MIQDPIFLTELACLLCAVGIICLAGGWILTARRLDQAEEHIARLLAEVRS